MSLTKQQIIFLASLTAAVLIAFIIGILIGQGTKSKIFITNKNYDELIDGKVRHVNCLMNEIDNKNIEETVK